MSSARRSRNNMEKGVLGLNEDEIQEELLNADLKALGINEDELGDMDTQEKRNLIAALKQSTNPHQEENSSHQNKNVSNTNNDEPISCGSSPNPRSVSDKNEIDITLDSPEEYPSLPSPSTNVRRSTPQPRQPLRSQIKVERQVTPKPQQQQLIPPKRPAEKLVEVVMVNQNQDDSDDNDVEEHEGEEEEEEDDDDDEVEDDDEDDDDDQPFNFPNFVDDTSYCLKQYARKKPMLRDVQYYMLPNQCTKTATRTMLKHYNSWYKTLCSLEKQNVLPDDSNIFTDVLKSNLKQEVKPTTSKSSEPVMSYSAKVSDGIRNNERLSLFKKSSSPEVEEIEVTEIKTTEMSRLTPNFKAKTLPRETRLPHNVHTMSSSSSPRIDVNFDEKWDADSGTWTTPRRGKRGLINNRTAHSEKETPFQPKDSPEIEEKVQCPICQLDFSLSKIETHAAACEGFPSETRSSGSTYSSKLEDPNTKDGFTSTTIVELTNSEPKIANKKRGN